MKRILIVTAFVFFLFAPAGCAKPEEAALYTLAEADFGTYSVPPGWAALEGEAADGRTFYVADDYAYTYESSNMIVEHGENDYYAAEYNQFLDAIAEQLSAQVTRLEEVTEEAYTVIGSEGFGSEKGNRVLMFEVEGIERTVQFYICGDHEYVLVQATKYGDGAGETVEESALEIVQSFEWK